MRNQMLHKCKSEKCETKNCGTTDAVAAGCQQQCVVFFRDNYTASRAEIQLQCSAEVLVR